MKAYRSASRTCSEDKKTSIFGVKRKDRCQARGHTTHTVKPRCSWMYRYTPEGAAVLSYRAKTSLACLAFPFLSLCKIPISSVFGGKSPNYCCLSATDSLQHSSVPLNFLNSSFVHMRNLNICFVYSSPSHLSKSLWSFLSVGNILWTILESTHHITISKHCSSFMPIVFQLKALIWGIR